MKRDDSKEELILNFGGGGAKTQNTQANAGGGLKLNESLNADKKESKIFTLTQKNPAENEIKDPFAKYDDVSNLDFTKKKNLGIEGVGSKKAEDETNKLSFGEKKSDLFAEKKEEPKLFTLDNKQQGPRRIFNPDTSAQQNQPLTLGSQPFSLSQNKQPQLRFGGGDQNNSEIKAIGKEPVKKDEGLKLGNSSNTGSIWDKKDKDSDFGGGFKLGGGEKNTDSGLKFGGGGGGGASIWDKKEQSAGIQEINKDQPKEFSTVSFNEKKKADKDEGLSFLNEKPSNADKKDNELNLGDDGKKPRRLKMGDKNEQKKQILADEMHGNDFFDDLDI